MTNTLFIQRRCRDPYIRDYIASGSFERPRQTELTAANDRYWLRPIFYPTFPGRLAVSYRRLRIDNLRFLSVGRTGRLATGVWSELRPDTHAQVKIAWSQDAQFHQNCKSETISAEGWRRRPGLNRFSHAKTKIEPKKTMRNRQIFD